MIHRRNGVRAVLLASVLAFSVSCASGQVHAWRKKLASPGLTVGINPRNPDAVYAEGSGAGLFASWDRGRTWTRLGSPGISSIRQILVHPSDSSAIFCAAIAGGLRKTTNNGLTWRTVITAFGIDGESVTYDPRHPDTMVAGNYSTGSVYRSTDRGETWTFMGATGAQLCACAVRPGDAEDVLAGTGGGRISRSTDGGRNWRLVKEGTSVSFQETPRIVYNPLDPDIAYATTFGNDGSTLDVWKTTDAGESWKRTALQATPVWALDIDPWEPQTVYAGTFTDDVAAVFRTTDGGASWSALSAGIPEGSYIWSLKVHPMEPQEVWLSATADEFGFGGIYRWSSSTTGVQGIVRDRATGSPVESGRIVAALTGDRADLAAGRGAYAFAYFDGDPSLESILRVEAFPYFVSEQPVEFIPDSIRTMDISLDRLSLARIEGAVRDSLLGRGVPATVELKLSTQLGGATLAVTAGEDGGFLFDSLYVSQPPVLSYTSLVVASAGFPYAKKTISPVLLDTAGLFFALDPRADVLVACEDSFNVLPYFAAACESSGLTAFPWNVNDLGPAPLGRGGEVRSNIVVYAAGSKRTPLSPAETDSLEAYLERGGRLFLTGQDLAELNDTTALFRKTLGLSYGGASPSLFVRGAGASELFGTTGFWTFGSGANNQVSEDILVPDTRIAVPVFGYGTRGASGVAAVRVEHAGAGRAVVFGFGFEAVNGPPARAEVFRRVAGYLTGSIVLAAARTPEPPLPGGLRLEQNYPNPWNPSTRVRYFIPGSSRVVLTVTDVLGRTVATPVDEVQNAGFHEAELKGDLLPSGVYFARLSAGGKTTVMKTLLLR